MRTEQERRGALAWVRSLVLTATALILIFTFLFRLVRVDGSSMRETLQDGDVVVTVSALLSGTPERGDIVVLRRADFEGGQPIIKRVIAVGGETVDIDFSAGVVYVDGAALEEPYIREPTYTPEGLEFPLTVPEGCIFVMGDNRNGSTDSRHPDLGAVDRRYVLGRAAVLALPGKSAETERRDWSRIGILN